MRYTSIPDTDIMLSIRNHRRKRLFILCGSFLGLILLAVLSAILGTAKLSPAEIWVFIKAGISGRYPSTLHWGKFSVVWDIRLPRIVMALFAGMSLSLGGTAMQGIMRNPLVSPYTLGISAASAFGASLAIVLGFPLFVMPAAFIFSLMSLMLVLFFCRGDRMQGESLILTGIAVMFIFSAGTSLLQYLASQDELVRIVFWLMGSLSSSTWPKALSTAGISIVSSLLLYTFSWPMNLLSSGDESAMSMGVDPRVLRMRVILIVTGMTTVIVSYTGIIGFIGLAAPHVARMLLGSDHRLLFPAAAITGAFFLLVSDTLARSLLSHTELPIGIITSFLGVPFLISILTKRRRMRSVP